MFIKRDENGVIVAVSLEELPQFKRAQGNEEREAKVFMEASSQRALNEADADFIRVLDDLINLMIDRRLIQFTDLPKAAQRKLLNRESLRENSGDLNLISSDDDGSIEL